MNNAKSPENIEWWICVHECTVMNGVFLYFLLRKLGYKVDIYENSEHVYLKDDECNIYIYI